MVSKEARFARRAVQCAPSRSFAPLGAFAPYRLRTIRRIAIRALTAAIAIASTAAGSVAPLNGSAVAQSAVASFRVTGAAIPEPLDGRTGDAARGRQIVLDRATGNCLICHKVPNEPRERFQGELGPDLAGVGARFNAGEIRLRMVDQARLNPATIMPPYHRVDGLNRVAPEWRGKPVLSAQEIEDIVAYLAGLK